MKLFFMNQSGWVCGRGLGPLVCGPWCWARWDERPGDGDHEEVQCTFPAGTDQEDNETDEEMRKAAVGLSASRWHLSSLLGNPILTCQDHDHIPLEAVR